MLEAWDLPAQLVWKNILPYVPCMDITPKILRRQFLMNRSMSVIRRCITLRHEEWSSVRQSMLQFDFTNNPCFEYVSDFIYLTVFFQNQRHDDYIVIYLSGR